jgi:hypothetical protein
MVQERVRLRPLRTPAKDFALRFPVVVSLAAEVRHGGVAYAMPSETIGRAATLHLYAERVRIVGATFDIEHARSGPAPGPELSE